MMVYTGVSCQVICDWLLRVLLLQVLWTTAKGIDIPAPPTNVKMSEITCTSARVSWDEATDGSVIDYNVEWRLLNDTAANTRSQEIRGGDHFMLSNLQPSNDNMVNDYVVSVSSVREGVKGNSSDVIFTTHSHAAAVQPSAIPSVSGVTIEWNIPAVNTGCDGHTINEYIIRYNPVGSTNVSEIPVQPCNSTKQNMIENINDTLSLTEYEYTVVAIDYNRTNISSDIQYFTTQDYRAPPPSLLSAELHSNSITVTWEPPNDAPLYKITHYVIQVIPLGESSANPIFHSFANNGTFFNSGTIANLMPDALYRVQVASKNTVGLGSFSTDHLFASTTSFVPAAPVNLSYTIVGNHTLAVSWGYPPTLTEQITSFEVAYNLVSAYNTSAGMKSFAEYDVFNTTESSFHFALVSSVTSYIFTVTPYSATRAGDSARILVDDFSGVDLAEDPVIFFNLKFSDLSNNSSDINNINSDLTRHMQSSINDICECTLPSYTLRGSMDSCDGSQSNCAIYTGRLLGSDTASTTEVFEMVEDWLATQNGSLLDGTLSVDPDCPLQRLSPSDAACSSPNITSDDTTGGDSSTEENEFESSDDRQGTDGIKMLAIGFASGFGIIICVVVICAGVFKSRKMMRQKKTNALTITHSESEARLTPLLQTTPFQQTPEIQRHYSVIVERNPSYNRHRNNVIKPFIISNDRQLEASSSDSLSSENAYSYTSLKTVQRQAEALGFRQQEGDGITQVTVEQPHGHASESYTNEHVVESLSSSGYYINEEYTTAFHASTTPNGHGSYLSVS